MSTVRVSPVVSARKKVTTLTFHQKKERGEAITMLTAYDYPTALAMDQAGVDSILVGDSLGMVVLGYENTLPVTMDEMLHHSRAVSRGAKAALLVGDMPFMSYQVSVEEAVRNPGASCKMAAWTPSSWKAAMSVLLPSAPSLERGFR
jgi:3-methyl-2-oxobutanoate hydroxymethyltransferase